MPSGGKKKTLKTLEKRLKEKNKFLQKEQEEKDVLKTVLLKVLNQQDALLVAKDTLLAAKEKELLKAHGLFTARGVIEHFARMAHSELAKGGKVPKRFNATDTLLWLDNCIMPAGGGKKYPCCKELLDKCNKCKAKHPEHGEGLTLAGIHGALCEDIHGHPWNMDSILEGNDLNPVVKCVIKSLGKQVGWRS